MAELVWLGHSAFKITSDGVSVLIDPFLDGNPKCPIASSDIHKADLVLVTHDHGDHTGQAVELCRTHNAMLGAVVGTAEKLVAQGLPPELVLNGIGFNIGGTLTYKNVQITMVQAFHTTESGTPVGYIVRMPSGLTVYHAGDTGIFGDMELWGKLYKIDVALLPIGGVFTMDARQAALACTLLRPRKVVPMHWGTFPVLAPDAQEFQHEMAAQAPACQCVVMLPGQTISL